MADIYWRSSLNTISSMALSNPLHSLLSLHRRCKDTIVLTVLQPHQVVQWDTRSLSCSPPWGFLLLFISLNTFPFTLSHTKTLQCILFQQCTIMQCRHTVKCYSWSRLHIRVIYFPGKPFQDSTMWEHKHLHETFIKIGCAFNHIEKIDMYNLFSLNWTYLEDETKTNIKMWFSLQFYHAEPTHMSDSVCTEVTNIFIVLR